MKKSLGISILFLVIFGVTAVINPNFLGPYNVKNLINWFSLYGILSVGVTFVIVTGGIDLSVGSVVGLCGTLLPWLLVQKHWSVPGALLVSLGVAPLMGLAHGLLITKLRLQPFVVTLCGLLIYRGIARTVSHDADQGFGNTYDDGLRRIATATIDLFGDYGVRPTIIVVLVIAVATAFFMHQTVWGRHLQALGRNEDAARYSGIHTHRLIILAYVLCSLLAGVGGILFALDGNSVQPPGQGNFFELYAIAAAVLGGCSLRGGEVSIFGALVGTAVMRLLYNSINLLGFPSQIEFIIIGGALLLAVIVDELLRRWRKV